MFTGLEGVKQYYSESVSEDKVADKVEEKVWQIKLEDRRFRASVHRLRRVHVFSDGP